jgi:hypothetical protein
MPLYKATMMDAETGGESRYPFDGPEDLLERTPVRVVRYFRELVDRTILPAEHVDYELNFALKNDHHKVITAAGTLIRENGGAIPFLLMIGRG